MKQKIVIKIAMNGEETKKKALKIAVGFTGVESAKGDKDKGQIEVEGEGVDPVKLTIQLRKKLAKRTFMDKLTLRCLCSNDEYAELKSVEQKKEDNPGANTPGDNGTSSVPPLPPPPPPICHFVVTEDYTRGCFF